MTALELLGVDGCYLVVHKALLAAAGPGFFLGGECSKLTSPNPVRECVTTGPSDMLLGGLGGTGGLRAGAGVLFRQTSHNAQILQELAETII